MKLYKAFKDPYVPFSKDEQTIHKNGWRQLLNLRSRADFAYPEYLNSLVLQLGGLQSDSRVEFTDRKEEAYEYAKAHKGSVIELEVPVEDLLSYFILEFKNFPKRRKSFEITYLIKGSDLAANQNKWGLFATKLDS